MTAVAQAQSKLHPMADESMKSPRHPDRRRRDFLKATMIRAIAKQAEAERTRRAKVIHAEGEKQAAATLVEAAKLLGADARAIQLRTTYPA
jgi:hypothetical protein